MLKNHTKHLFTYLLSISFFLLSSLLSYGQDDCCLANAGDIASVEITLNDTTGLFDVTVIAENYLPTNDELIFSYILTEETTLNILTTSSDGHFENLPLDYVDNFTVFLGSIPPIPPIPDGIVTLSLALIGTAVDCYDLSFIEEPFNLTEDVGLHEFEVPEPIPSVNTAFAENYIVSNYPNDSISASYCNGDEYIYLSNETTLQIDSLANLLSIGGLNIENLPSFMLEIIESEGFSSIIEVEYQDDGSFAIEVEDAYLPTQTYLTFEPDGTFIETVIQDNLFNTGDCCQAESGSIASIEITASSGDSLYAVQVVSENYQMDTNYLFAYLLVTQPPNLVVEQISYDGYFETNMENFNILAVSILKSELPVPLEVYVNLGSETGPDTGSIISCFDQEFIPETFTMPDDIGTYQYTVEEPTPVPDISDFLNTNYPDVEILCYGAPYFELSNGLTLIMDPDGTITEITGLNLGNLPQILVDTLATNSYTPIEIVASSFGPMVVVENPEQNTTNSFFVNPDGSLGDEFICQANPGTFSNVDLQQVPGTSTITLTAEVTNAFSGDPTYSLSYLLVNASNELMDFSENGILESDHSSEHQIIAISHYNQTAISNWNNFLDENVDLLLNELFCLDYIVYEETYTPIQPTSLITNYLDLNYSNAQIIDWEVNEGIATTVVLDNGITIQNNEEDALNLTGLNLNNLPEVIENYLLINDLLPALNSAEVSNNEDNQSIIALGLTDNPDNISQLFFDVYGNLIDSVIVIPPPVLPDGIVLYLANNYPNDSIIDSMEVNGILTDIELDNGINISFDPEGTIEELTGLNEGNLPANIDIEEYINSSNLTGEIDSIAVLPPNQAGEISLEVYTTDGLANLTYDYEGILLNSNHTVTGLQDLSNDFRISYSQEKQSLIIKHSIINNPLNTLKNLQIYNTAGQIIYRVKTPNSTTSKSIIDLSNQGLSTGVFFVQVQLGNHLLVYKFVVQ